MAIPATTRSRSSTVPPRRLSCACSFLDDPTVPPDNNRSEAALRVVALGRKNFLVVGNEDAGDNIAGLYSLVATWEANDANPIEYFGDVLLSIGTHPAERNDEFARSVEPRRVSLGRAGRPRPDAYAGVRAMGMFLVRQPARWQDR